MGRILLTGATGYIGGGLVAQLEQAGHDVICLVRKTPSSHGRSVVLPPTVEELSALMFEEKVEAVVHLASLYLASHQPGQAAELVESNVLFPTRLAEAMKMAGVRRLLNTGTVFQAASGQPGTPFNLYAATKQAYEEILGHYVRNEGFRVLTLRLADTYGLGDPRQKIVCILLDALRKNIPLDLSPGEQKLSLTWVEDVRRGFVMGVDHLFSWGDACSEMFGLCHPCKMSLKEIAAVAEECLGKQGEFHWGARSYRAGEIMDPILPDPLPGWAPSVGLREGLGMLWADGSIPTRGT